MHRARLRKTKVKLTVVGVQWIAQVHLRRTTPPVIPFLPLNLYGTKEASEKECRMQCRAAPIISSSYFGDGNRRQVPTSPCKKRSKILITISVPCVGAACCEPIRLRNNFRSCRDCAIHSSFPSALRNLE